MAGLLDRSSRMRRRAPQHSAQAFIGREGTGQPFEIRFDDLTLRAPLFADGFETDDTSEWSHTVGGTP